MRKNRTFVIIGAGVILFLLISNSAIAGLISTYKTYEMLKDKNSINSEKETYIDPDIYLTTKHLFLLKISVPNIENKDVRELTQKIINIIQKEGSVDSEQIRQIISYSHYEIAGVHTNCFITSISSTGTGYALPGLIRSNLFAFFSKGGLLLWSVGKYHDSWHSNVYIGGTLYNYDNEGLALPFIGFVHAWTFTGSFPPHPKISFIGYASYVVVQ